MKYLSFTSFHALLTSTVIFFRFFSQLHWRILSIWWIGNGVFLCKFAEVLHFPSDFVTLLHPTTVAMRIQYLLDSAGSILWSEWFYDREWERSTLGFCTINERGRRSCWTLCFLKHTMLPEWNLMLTLHRQQQGTVVHLLTPIKSM